MRILALGDVVGEGAILHLEHKLWKYRLQNQIDMTVVNGENASAVRGLCQKDARRLLDAGADVLTLGNHTYGMRDLYPFLEEESCIIRPANYPPTCPGAGYTVITVCGYRVLCINVQGRVYLDPLDSPFDAVDKILTREAGNYDFSILDIHAEATSEKLAIAHWFDGRIPMMFGTHTHVPTADARVLPKGSGYVTDLGMTGPVDGIIGTKAEQVIERFRTAMPTRFDVAEGEIEAQGVIFDYNTDTGRVQSVTRISF
ncbi:MAG: YmdB family metallophosphoesterase [Clostridia bacterium]|nr:YmdB family metallophosphoesterase [Clostridia bacterium]